VRECSAVEMEADVGVRTVLHALEPQNFAVALSAVPARRKRLDRAIAVFSNVGSASLPDTRESVASSADIELALRLAFGLTERQDAFPSRASAWPLVISEKRRCNCR